MASSSSTTQPEHRFVIEARNWCPHLTTVKPLPHESNWMTDVCKECHDETDGWVCLQCYETHCGRETNQHAVCHATEHDNHLIVLSKADLSAWCYACDDYIHNEALIPAKNAYHLHKFGNVAY